jgi:Replication factor-A protein 1, N-terminal domain/Replication protein A OB domain/Replication factor-A C terminal domain
LIFKKFQKMELDYGVLKSIMEEGNINVQPIVQIVKVVQLRNRRGEFYQPPRFRLLLSDGSRNSSSYASALLVEKTSQLVAIGEAMYGSVIQVKEFCVNQVRDRSIIVALSMCVLLKTSALIFHDDERASSSSNVATQRNVSLSTPPATTTVLSRRFVSPTKLQFGGLSASQEPSLSPFCGSSSSSTPPSSAAVALPLQFGGSPQQSDAGAPPVLRGDPAAAQRRLEFGGSALASTTVASPERGAGAKTVSIESLTPYMLKWTIEAHVTAKSPMRTWANEKSCGNMFSVDLLDVAHEPARDIRCIMWRSVADSFYDTLQPGNVYKISDGRVQAKNAKFNPTSHIYEIVLHSDSSVVPAADKMATTATTATTTPTAATTTTRLRIDQLASCAPDSVVDVLAVAVDVGDTVQQRTRRGDMVAKRIVHIADSSLKAIELTLWAAHAEEPLRLGDIIEACRVKASSWNGRSLTSTVRSRLAINPSTPDSLALRTWFRSSTSFQFVHLSRPLKQVAPQQQRVEQAQEQPVVSQREQQHIVYGCIADLRAQAHRRLLIEGERIFEATLARVRIDSMSKHIAYMSCAQCRKKLIDVNGKHFCSRCQRHFDAPDFSYILSMSLADDNVITSKVSARTETLRVRAFNQVGEALFSNRPARELAARHVAPLLDEIKSKRYLVSLRAQASSFVANTVEYVIARAHCL